MEENLKLEKEYRNEEVKTLYLELIKNEDWKKSFRWANDPFKGANGMNRMYKINSFANVSDGVKELLTDNSCFWFMDFLIGINRFSGISREMQVWYLLIKEGKNYIICEDGNNNVLIAYVLPFTDFKNHGNDAVCLWFINDLLLLPEEY